MIEIKWASIEFEYCFPNEFHKRLYLMKTSIINSFLSRDLQGAMDALYCVPEIHVCY